MEHCTYVEKTIYKHYVKKEGGREAGRERQGDAREGGRKDDWEGRGGRTDQ